MIEQGVQVGGAIMILLAFALAQTGRMNQHATSYLLLNLTGAVVLTILAYFERQWGFFLLEFVWAAVSIWGLFVHHIRPTLSQSLAN